MSVPEAWGIPHLATASAVRNEAWFPGGIVTVFRLRQRGDIIVVRLFRFIVLRAGLLRQQRLIGRLTSTPTRENLQFGQ